MRFDEAPIEGRLRERYKRFFADVELEGPLVKFRTARITEWGTLVVLLSYAALAVRWSDCYEAYHVALTASSHMVELHSEAPFTPP